MAATSFLTTQYSNPNFLAMMSVASGILHLVQTGILHKTRAAAPLCLLSTLQQNYPETSWQQSPWAQQGKIWSSSSAVSALDMVATWIHEHFWDRSEAVEYALAGVGVRPTSDYEY